MISSGDVPTLTVPSLKVAAGLGLICAVGCATSDVPHGGPQPAVFGISERDSISTDVSFYIPRSSSLLSSIVIQIISGLLHL